MRTGSLEITFYRQGAEYSRPTTVQWDTKSIWCLRAEPGPVASPADLLMLELRGVMERIDGWVLAEAHVMINQCRFGQAPVLFRFGPEADLLPTGVVPFEVPMVDWSASPPVNKGSEMWHVTIRGRGAA